jgi:hypothetical protein
MTRKDYKLIAECISKADTIQQVIDNLCLELKQDNIRFNSEKFREACLPR